MGKIPWSRAWQETPVFLPGKSHGQKNLAGYSPLDGLSTHIAYTWPFLLLSNGSMLDQRSSVKCLWFFRLTLGFPCLDNFTITPTNINLRLRSGVHRNEDPCIPSLLLLNFFSLLPCSFTPWSVLLFFLLCWYIIIPPPPPSWIFFPNTSYLFKDWLSSLWFSN